MILGLGTDLVEISELRRRVERTPEIREQVYDATELAFCDAQRTPWPWLARCFAAKEAVMKALGTGWAQGVTFRDIAVVPVAATETGGRPSVEVRLSGETAARVAGEKARVVVSLSHDGNYAVAMAVLTTE